MDLRIILLLFIGASILKVSKTSHSGCQLNQNCDKVSQNVDNEKIDTIFVGKIVHFFPPKEREKRKNGNKKQKRNCNNSIPGNDKCSKMKNVSALIEVKRIYMGEEQSKNNQYFIVEGLSNVDKIGDAKLFLSAKLYEGVYKVVETILPNKKQVQRVLAAKTQLQDSTNAVSYRNLEKASKGKHLNYLFLLALESQCLSVVMEGATILRTRPNCLRIVPSVASPIGKFPIIYHCVLHRCLI